MECSLIVPLVRSICPINPWLARFACTVIYVAFVALRKVVPKLDLTSFYLYSQPKQLSIVKWDVFNPFIVSFIKATFSCITLR